MDKETIQKHLNYSVFYKSYLKGPFKAQGDEVKAICSFHEDRDPSLSFNIKTGLFQCFGCKASGDVFDFYAKINRLNIQTDFQKIISGIAKDFNITEMKTHNKNDPFIHYELGKPDVIYNYTDESDKILYHVCRFKLPKKDFRQCKPDGKTWNLQGIKPVLYRLPDVKKAQQIIIVEGEKDVETLRGLGYVATCNPMGAGKWRDEYSDSLAGKDIILLPDNDQPGRDHGNQVIKSLQGKAKSIKLINLPGLSEKGDVSDYINSFGDDKDGAGESLAMMIDGAPEYQAESSEGINIIKASDWLNQETPEPDQVIEGIFETGDKFAVIASSKLRKSFFLLQMSLCLAAGKDFFQWPVPIPRKVLYCQFEIKSNHQHRRLKRMCRALGISAEDLQDRFYILNGRGLGIMGPGGVTRIWQAAEAFKPEIITFDPLYKLMEGVENAAEDGKKILYAFDQLVEKSGAAVLYVHHDAKGSPGDRDIRDRGAGSNVLARDYDACLTLTAHATEADSAVVEALLRNYRPQDPFTVQWSEDESTGGYRFEMRSDILPEKKTSKTKRSQPELSTYLPIAESLLEHGEYEIGTFKMRLKEKTGLSDKRYYEFLTFATTGDNPHFITRQERGRGINNKWISLA